MSSPKPTRLLPPGMPRSERFHGLQVDTAHWRPSTQNTSLWDISGSDSNKWPEQVLERDSYQIRDCTSVVA